jgi:hypothetical protein
LVAISDRRSHAEGTRLHGHRVLAGVLAFIALIYPAISTAQQEPVTSTHWAFSAFFGSGWYDISDSESVFIIRAPLGQTIRTSSYDLDHRTVGIEIHYPLTIGLHNIDSFNDLAVRENFGTVAFTPGIELEIPITGRWYLRPVLHVGWGTETNGGDSAWIYYGGIKSRFTPGNSELDWSLLNGIYHAAYNGEAGDKGSVSMAMLGAEFHHPLESATLRRDDLQLNWHLTYSWLFDEAQFETYRSFDQSVRDQWELGFALAPRGRSFKIWFLSFEQMGISLRASSNGEYRAITVNMSSPFH